MFVKKLVDRATKKSGGTLNGLRGEDINPRLVFHYGIPAGSNSLAYDPIQKILGISTKDGRIKLFGRDNTQCLLESNEVVPSKFLEFLDNEGILLNVNIQNHIEVWDIRKKQLSYVYDFGKEISSFTVIKQSLFMYVGDAHGNISILNLDRETWHLVKMQYCIPFKASHGRTTKCAADSPVMSILPQPLVESKRVLIIFQDGLITLWVINESIAIFTSGGIHAVSNEVRKVTSACWACPSGSKVAVGYNNGDILLWSVPVVSNHKNVFKTEKEELCAVQNVPISKLNLGYKIDRIPIVFLRWISGGQLSRLYVNGMSEDRSSHSFQVVVLQEYSESRIVKLVLSLPKPCKSMTIFPSIYERDNHKQDLLLLLLESGHLYAFDDSQIERYLLHSQQSKTSSLPNHVTAKIPFINSTVTVAKIFSENSDFSSFVDEDNVSLKNFPSVIPVSVKGKDGNYSLSTRSRGFTKTNNLYITGHSNGAINFWDASYPFFQLLLSVQQQSEDDHSLTGIPITALYFDVTSRVLVSGDQHGMVRIFRFKPEQGGSARQGCSFNISGIKLMKVIGSVASINVNHFTGHLLVGSDEGCVTIIDMEGSTVLSQKRFSSELYIGVMSLQSVKGSLSGIGNILLVALRDSSVLALDGDSGNQLNTGVVRSKKPTKALFMDVLDGQSTLSNGLDSSRVSSPKDYEKQWSVLLCSEKAVRLYSFMHLIQGIKKVQNKKKFHGTCFWASTFTNPTLDTGLVLLFANGKIEIRSLPELYLLKEMWLRGFAFPSPSPNLSSELSCCTSSGGEIIVVNGNQEIFLISTLSRRDIYRHVDLIGQVCKDVSEDGITSAPVVHKEERKGFLNVVMNDVKGMKTKQSQEKVIGDSEMSFRELAVKFSASNFPLDNGHRDAMDTGDNVDLDIDDIDLEDHNDKPKTGNISKLNKQTLTGKLQAIKGKLKKGKIKIGSTSTKDESKEEKYSGEIDDIKKKYGYPLAGDTYIGNLSKSKLNENLKKLQDVNTRAAELQGTAQSFSATAKELLRTLEHQKRNS